MTKKMLFTYHEVARILGYGTYDAVRMAVNRGAIKAVTRPGDRRKFITRSEIARVLALMGMAIDRIETRAEEYAA